MPNLGAAEMFQIVVIIAVAVVAFRKLLKAIESRNTEDHPPVK